MFSVLSGHTHAADRQEDVAVADDCIRVHGCRVVHDIKARTYNNNNNFIAITYWYYSFLTTPLITVLPTPKCSYNLLTHVRDRRLHLWIRFDGY